MSSITTRFEQVLARIAGACARSGRSPDQVELIVITKNHPVDLVVELSDLGQDVFGENRDQEAKPKSAALSELRPNAQARWHFVGQLQTNKVKSVLGYASSIHSIDRDSLVAELSKVLTRNEQQVDGFIELNLTGDPGRGGVLPENLGQLAEKVLQEPRIKLRGLMAVAGLGVDARSEFDRVLAIQEVLLSISPESRDLSLGMSEDFEAAIEMGATHIRVGSAITGPRANNA
ncbi:MAG: YggS family pyridoxal phosphate-dependent enzyme [Aquiluna sp.]|nr:YggS family pyridoxal phosphate-dependent enzyme [Aquiluna sp.]MCF8544965.1 YggS family pyridoxal phosphate-dependent enzyme [Aquiluna sp.]